MTSYQAEPPSTAIVIGSGCSMNLGVPTLAGFMDKVLDEQIRSAYTAEDPPSPDDELDTIRRFFSHVKGSSAIVQNQFINIEEIYGLAEMLENLEGCEREENRLGARTKEVLNRAIFRIAIRAGEEFVTDKHRIHKYVDGDTLLKVKQESQTESPAIQNMGNRFTTLLAYLCLAAHRDTNGKHPLFIQFNWDLALDRALGLNHDCSAPSVPWYPESDLDYHKGPVVARPHGAINWACGSVDDTEKSSPVPGQQEAKIVLQAIWKSVGPEKSWSHDLAIEPPTWRKGGMSDIFSKQWEIMHDALKRVRKIVFVGYSLPRTDLYFRHFLALALTENPYTPKVYVWNPAVFEQGDPVQQSYCEIFRPLAAQGRLYGIRGYFGDPALFDLERAMSLAERLGPA